MSRKSEALPGEARITKKKDYERIKREGVWIRGENFDVIVARAPGKISRLGLIVPLHSHNVVERNVLKRRLRELMRRKFLPDMRDARDVVVRARKKAYDKDYESVRIELEKIFQRYTETKHDS
jgi:ribonuclease P protein component